MFLISVSDGDVIYQTFKNEDGNVSVAKFIAVSFIVKYVFSWMQVLAICNTFHFLFSEINFLQNLCLRRNSIDHKLIYILNYVKKNRFKNVSYIEFLFLRLWKKLVLESRIEGYKKQWQTLHSIYNKKILKDLWMRQHSEGIDLTFFFQLLIFWWRILAWWLLIFF